MRQASNTMSCEAERKATSKASPASSQTAPAASSVAAEIRAAAETMTQKNWKAKRDELLALVA